MEIFVLFIVAIIVAGICIGVAEAKELEKFTQKMADVKVDVFAISCINNSATLDVTAITSGKMSEKQAATALRAAKSKTVMGFKKITKEVMVGTAVEPVFIPYADVIGCEVKTNGNSVTKTNRGSQAAGAAIGAVALGGVGLLLGGLTGSKTNRESLMKVEVVIQTLHENYPSHTVTLFKATDKKGLEPTSAKAEAIAKEAATWLGRFNQLIKLNERAAMKQAAQPVQKVGIEEQLTKLWALVEAGGLTKQEYDDHKRKLLSAA